MLELLPEPVVFPWLLLPEPVVFPWLLLPEPVVFTGLLLLVFPKPLFPDTVIFMFEEFEPVVLLPDPINGNAVLFITGFLS